MNVIGRLIVVTLGCLNASIGWAQAIDCRPNGDRMIDLKAGLLWCLDPANNAANNARHAIIFGRYNSAQYGPMVKKGYGDCQSGRNAYQNYDFCDEESFITGAFEVLSDAARSQYPEASVNPFPPSDGGSVNRTCYTNSGRWCNAGQAAPNSSCSCNGEPGRVR